MTAPPQSELPVGTVLEGKFRITREVGRGGMAVIYEAVHVDIGKRVAVKLLSQDLVTSRVVRERFLREARAAAAIRSPHICEVYDSGMYEERPFLVMELLEGESLYERLTRVRRMDVETTLKVIDQTARGLAKAHQAGVIHRDLKPENIFLTTDEDGHLLTKLVDFGLAKFYEADGENVRLTREGALFGTPAYMSPEQAKGHGGVDHRADLWALGCIVYECLTGKTVWNVDQGVAMILAQIAAAPVPQPSLQFPDLPSGFDAWLARALSRMPEERFQTPRELAETLHHALLTDVTEADLVSDTDLAPPVMSRSDPMQGSLPSPNAPPQPLVSLPAPRLRPRNVWPMRLALGTLAAALGGYVAWLFVFQPAQTPKVAAAALEPLEKEAYALKVNTAQFNLSQGQSAEALKQFQAAVDLGQAPVARSLLQRLEIIVEQSRDSANRCQVTGLGRPRPFDVLKPASRPTLTWTSEGPLVAWADNALEPEKRQISAAFLDGSLRRISIPYRLTPESTAVSDPILVNLKNHILAVYSDTGVEPGLYVRAWNFSNHSLGPATRLSAAKRYPFSAAVAATTEGELWFTWEESNADGSVSLLLRHVNTSLAPTGPATRVITLAPRFRPGVTHGISKPTLAVTGTKLRLVFAQELTPVRYQIQQLLIDLSDPKLREGVAGRAPEVTPDTDPIDLHLGELSPVSDSDGRNSQPQLDCSSAGDCFVAWDTGTENATLARLTAGAATAWRRTISATGSRPMLAHNGAVSVVVWFDQARLKLASLNKEGLGAATVLTRVTGAQPHPSVAAGERAGVWYVAWRDFEAGHLEAFALRTECQ